MVEDAEAAFQRLQTLGLKWAVVADTEDGAQPRIYGADVVSLDMHARLASVSKLFIGLIYARLVAEEELEPDSDVDTILRDYKGLAGVTLRDLAEHRTGLQDALHSRLFRWRVNRDVRAAQPLELVVKSSLGLGRQIDRRAYSNINATLLAMACEKVAGRPMAELVADIAGDDGAFRLSADGALPAPQAPGWHSGRTEGKVQFGDTLFPATHYNPTWAGHAGAITARLGALAEIVDRVLRPLADLVPEREPGFHSLARVNGPWLYHAGDVPGFSAWAGLNRDTGRAAVAASGLSWVPGFGNPAELMALAALPGDYDMLKWSD